MTKLTFKKGGDGSGHWGHAGNPPHKGGSVPSTGGKTGAAMSIRTGRSAKDRQEMTQKYGVLAKKIYNDLVKTNARIGKGGKPVGERAAVRQILWRMLSPYQSARGAKNRIAYVKSYGGWIYDAQSNHVSPKQLLKAIEIQEKHHYNDVYR